MRRTNRLFLTERRAIAGVLLAMRAGLVAAAVLSLFAGHDSAAQQQAPAVQAKLAGAVTLQAGDRLQIEISGVRHSLNAQQILISFTRDGDSRQGASVPALTAEDRGNGVYRIAASIPESLHPEQPAKYWVAISGADSTGGRFVAGQNLAITVTPPAAIDSLSLGSARAGQTVSVRIKGEYTDFVAGATLASFGPGISVGGAAPGAPGTVGVVSATEAIASVRVPLDAALGARDVMVTTGAHSAARKDAFAIQPRLRQPNVVAGGPYTGIAGVPLRMDGSGSSDPNNSALELTWNTGDNSTIAGDTVEHIFALPGTYTVTVTGTDAAGATVSVHTTATITEADVAPAATMVAPQKANAGEAVVFSASAGAGAPTYHWSFGDGSTATGTAPTHTFADAGTYAVTLTAEDGRGQSTTTTSKIVVGAGAESPVANPGGPYAGLAGQAIRFDGSASSAARGDKLTYAWSFGDGENTTGVRPAHVYAQPGNYTVSLTVENQHHVANTLTTLVTIPAAPNPATNADATPDTAAASPVAAPGGPYHGIPKQPIQFDGSQSYDPPKAKALTFAWNFGDKTTGTGVQPTHQYAQPGSYTVSLTVSDGAATASATTTATITQVIGVTITSPSAATLTNKPTIAVTGTVSETGAKIVVNGEVAMVSGEKWTAKSVALREGVNLITATASDKKGSAGTANLSVTLDTTPPAVSIVSPAANAKAFSPQLTVSGLVSDLVAGTVNAQQVAVAVNGVPASVVNRSFSAPVLLSPGLNTINVVATDKAGNIGKTAVQVKYQQTVTQQTILPISGDGQTGVINSTLTQPLVVQLVAANGQPVAGRPVTFTVTRSDGEVEVLPSQSNALSVLTDAKGHASVLFKIGSRAGVGINQVTASSPGFTGHAVFAATSIIDKPAFIHPVIGEHQRGVIGQPAPQPFQVIVTDRAGNPLENVPVTFAVTAGGGNIGGKSTVVQDTNSDGKATVSITLGLQEGVNNNLVSANYAGNKGTPIVFEASGIVPGAASATTITGVVLDNSNAPVKGATVSLEGTSIRTTTNAQGQFTLKKVPVGTETLLVDGATSSSTITYPSLSFVLQALPGVSNSLDKPIYLPAIDTENAQTVGGNVPVTLTMRGVAGVAFTVQPHSVTFPDGSHVGKLSVSQVKADMVPMEPVNGTSAPLVWTIQPAGTKFNPPIQVQLPNVNGMAPGTVTEIYQYDHDLEQFVSAGTARVSPDGSVITSDPGFGISKAGWGHQQPPEPPPGCTIDCNDHSVCLQGYFVPTCACRQKAINIGGACGPNGAPTNNCMTAGTCDQYGGCSGAKPKPGAKCGDDDNFCDDNPVCQSDGSCKGTPFKDEDQDYPEISWDLGPVFKEFAEVLSETTEDELEVEAKVSLERKVETNCCEEKKIKPNHRTEDTYKGAVAIKGKVYYPALTFVLPGTKGKIGPYAEAGLEVNVGITNTTDKCEEGCLYGGPFGVAGKFQLGADATDPTGTYKFSANGEVTIASINLQVSGDCKSAVLTGQVGKAELQVEAQAGNTKVKLWNYTLFEGAPFISSTVPLDPAPQ